MSATARPPRRALPLEDRGAGGGAERSGRSRARPAPFVLYVEGPRDRDILQRWAGLLSPRLARGLAACAVILGGRRPARALEHFRTAAEAERPRRGLCVLDRDGGADGSALDSEPGLEFFTWRRRHIESYLLVPEAIRRTLRLDAHDSRLERLFREHVPGPDDEAAWRDTDAKRLLDHRGPIARGLGRAPAPGRIARAMREAELHGDVVAVLDRVRAGLGLRRGEHPLFARER